MNTRKKCSEIRRLPTGIDGFDFLSGGGLPEGRATLIAGTAGSGKTIIASQFLAEGVKKAGEGGVFVTFEESPADIRCNVKSFNWDIDKWEAQGKFAFVDVSPEADDTTVIIGEYDLGALLARIENAIRKVGAKRVALDSLGAVFTNFPDSATVRHELFRIASSLKKMGVTTVMTVERNEEYGNISRFGVEEFVADNVVILRNVLEHEKRRRTLEILKFRGAMHYKGEYTFTILPGEGITVIPISDIALKQKSSSVRTTSGSRELDNMCGGGFFRDSVILISGATGAGKTLMATQFIAGGVNKGEKGLLFGFEESREQVYRNARGWGVDYAKMEREGKLKVFCEYPETAGLEDYLIRMKQLIQDFKPSRLAVDSISALERVSNAKVFRDFVISLASFIKYEQITGLFTYTSPNLIGGTSIAETHISTITDLIILLRYVETYEEMQRGLTVLKMRGSKHDKSIREFNIDDSGIHIGKPFHRMTGILSGEAVQFPSSELERIDALFEDAGKEE